MAGEGVQSKRVFRSRSNTAVSSVGLVPVPENVRQTRAASKRSANDDSRSGSTVLHPRKRLFNLRRRPESARLLPTSLASSIKPFPSSSRSVLSHAH